MRPPFVVGRACYGLDDRLYYIHARYTGSGGPPSDVAVWTANDLPRQLPTTYQVSNPSEETHIQVLDDGRLIVYGVDRYRVSTDQGMTWGAVQAIGSPASVGGIHIDGQTGAFLALAGLTANWAQFIGLAGSGNWTFHANATTVPTALIGYDASGRIQKMRSGAYLLGMTGKYDAFPTMVLRPRILVERAYGQENQVTTGFWQSAEIVPFAADEYTAMGFLLDEARGLLLVCGDRNPVGAAASSSQRALWQTVGTLNTAGTAWTFSTAKKISPRLFPGGGQVFIQPLMRRDGTWELMVRLGQGWLATFLRQQALDTNGTVEWFYRSDDLDDTAGVALTAHAMTLGAYAWTAHAGVFTFALNTVDAATTVATATTADDRAVFDAGRANGTYCVLAAMGSNTGQPVGIIGRVQDASNYWLVDWDTTTVRIIEVTAGVPTTRASASWAAALSGTARNMIRTVWSGSTIIVDAGYTSASLTYTSSSYLTETKFGIAGKKSGVNAHQFYSLGFSD